MTHYYSEQQSSDLNLVKLKIRVGEIEIPMFSGSGVFSKKKLDKGTEILLKNMEVEDGLKILDLGCGIGIVGVYVKKMFPETDIFLSDVNRRAVLLTKKNLELNNILGRTQVSDAFNKIKDSFDIILLNPPQVAGKEMCFRLIQESYEHLNKGGKLEIVARHNKGGKSYSRKMEEIFNNVREGGKGAGYRVYISMK